MTMKNRDLYVKDPGAIRLLNNGVAEVAEVDTDQLRQTLRFELETFVCKGEYQRGLVRILETFLGNLGQPEQPPVWVSGFYGSGKSHLVKMLRYLWTDYEFPDGATARGVASLSTDVDDLLAELTTRGKQFGGLHSASGKLGAGAGNSIRLAVLSIIFPSVGLPKEYAQARFVIWLKQNGFYDTVRARVEAAGKMFDQELRHLYVSPCIAEGVLAADSNFAPSVKDVRSLIKQQFQTPADITDDEMLAVIRDVLIGSDGKLPCTLLAFDEIQQYIGDEQERSRQVYEIAEAIEKHLDGRVMLVGTGQSALHDTPLLQKIAGRFLVRLHLSDNDVETVTREMILLKHPERMPTVKQTLDECDGEVSRHLRETDIGPRPEDREILAADYPLLPVRRRFWESVLRAVDPGGTAAQLRTQLRIVFEAAKETADAPVGTVIAGDFIYEQIAQDLLQSGVLLREIHEEIEQYRKGGPEGELRARLGTLIYLIGRLPREEGADTGVRATADSLSDLLVTDLQAGSATFRSQVGDILQQMAETGKLMKIGDEYRMQTKQSSAWEGEYQQRRSRLLTNDQQVASLRSERLKAECERRLKDIRLLHGKCKARRSIEFHYGPDPPKTKGSVVPVWIRDGWSDSLKSVQEDAHQAGVDSPIVFVFIERREADELKQRLAELKAAEETIDVRDEPSSPEGKEARRAMETRSSTAASKLAQTVTKIFNQTLVFQGGGSDIDTGTLAEKVQTGAKFALARMFTKFKDADDARWDQVLKKARDGDANALESVDYQGEVAKHPVCSAILGFVGSGKKGREIRGEFAGEPYGWPQDAVDACLVLLTLTEHLQATQNERPVLARQLDQAKIGPATFRVESRPLTAAEKIKLRKLFQTVDIGCKPNEEPLAASKFLAELQSRAKAAGGDPPLPAQPSTKHIDDLEKQSGNEQLASILAAEDRLAREASDWAAASALIAERNGAWNDLQRLLDHARDLPVAKQVRLQRDAIRDQRALLSEPDPVPLLCEKLTQALRESVKQAHQQYEQSHAAEIQRLTESEVWQKLPEDDRGRILRQQGLGEVAPVKLGTQKDVLTTLQQRTLPSWQDHLDALPTRFEKARVEAAKRSEPKASTVKVPAATLRNEEDVDLWLDAVRGKIMEYLQDGPVIIT
jgi:hypothetical protein